MAGVTGAAANELEAVIFGEYLTMNKPRIYQVYQCNNDFKKVQAAIRKMDSSFGFISSTEFDDYAYMVTVDTPSTIEVSFASYKRILIRPKNEDGEFIGEEKVPEVMFYIFSAEFMPFENGTIVVIKYPPLVMESNKLHDYESEAQYFIEWTNDNLNIDPKPIALKKFYESIESANGYQRAGFKARELSVRKHLIAASFGVDIRDSAQASRAYQDADDILQEEVAQWVLDELVKSDKRNTLSGTQKTLIEQAIMSMSFAERYFNLIHTRCKFGRGYLKYEKKKGKTLSYTLEYEEDCLPLIRCRKQGWEAFEPAFNEIKKFIRAT